MLNLVKQVRTSPFSSTPFSLQFWFHINLCFSSSLFKWQLVSHFLLDAPLQPTFTWAYRLLGSSLKSSWSTCTSMPVILLLISSSAYKFFHSHIKCQQLDLHRSVKSLPPIPAPVIQEAFQVLLGWKPFSLHCLLSQVLQTIHFHHAWWKKSLFSASFPEDYILPLNLVSSLYFWFLHRPQL